MTTVSSAMSRIPDDVFLQPWAPCTQGLSIHQYLESRQFPSSFRRLCAQWASLGRPFIKQLRYPSGLLYGSAGDIPESIEMLSSLQEIMTLSTFAGYFKEGIVPPSRPFAELASHLHIYSCVKVELDAFLHPLSEEQQREAYERQCRAMLSAFDHDRVVCSSFPRHDCIGNHLWGDAYRMSSEMIYRAYLDFQRSTAPRPQMQPMASFSAMNVPALHIPTNPMAHTYHSGGQAGSGSGGSSSSIPRLTTSTNPAVFLGGPSSGLRDSPANFWSSSGGSGGGGGGGIAPDALTRESLSTTPSSFSDRSFIFDDEYTSGLPGSGRDLLPRSSSPNRTNSSLFGSSVRRNSSTFGTSSFRRSSSDSSLSSPTTAASGGPGTSSSSIPAAQQQTSASSAETRAEQNRRKSKKHYERKKLQRTLLGELVGKLEKTLREQQESQRHPGSSVCHAMQNALSQQLPIPTLPSSDSNDAQLTANEKKKLNKKIQNHLESQRIIQLSLAADCLRDALGGGLSSVTSSGSRIDERTSSTTQILLSFNRQDLTSIHRVMILEPHDNFLLCWMHFRAYWDELLSAENRLSKDDARPIARFITFVMRLSNKVAGANNPSSS